MSKGRRRNRFEMSSSSSSSILSSSTCSFISSPSSSATTTAVAFVAAATTVIAFTTTPHGQSMCSSRGEPALLNRCSSSSLSSSSSSSSSSLLLLSLCNYTLSSSQTFGYRSAAMNSLRFPYRHRRRKRSIHLCTMQASTLPRWDDGAGMGLGTGGDGGGGGDGGVSPSVDSLPCPLSPSAGRAPDDRPADAEAVDVNAQRRVSTRSINSERSDVTAGTGGDCGGNSVSDSSNTRNAGGLQLQPTVRSGVANVPTTTTATTTTTITTTRATSLPENSIDTSRLVINTADVEPEVDVDQVTSFTTSVSTFELNYSNVNRPSALREKRQKDQSSAVDDVGGIVTDAADSQTVMVKVSPSQCPTPLPPTVTGGKCPLDMIAIWRGRLSVYLLERGATHSQVASVSATLEALAVELTSSSSSSSLTTSAQTFQVTSAKQLRRQRRQRQLLQPCKSINAAADEKQLDTEGDFGGGGGSGGSGSGSARRFDAVRLSPPPLYGEGQSLMGTWELWESNLSAFVEEGFTGGDLAMMLAVEPRLLWIGCYKTVVQPCIDMLREKLALRPTDLRRVFRRAPAVISVNADAEGGTALRETFQILEMLGLRGRNLKAGVLKWPRLLTFSASRYFQLAAWLSSDEVGIKASEVGRLLRQAPMLVEGKIDENMRVVVEYLTDQIGVEDLGRMLRAYPQLLLCDLETELMPKVNFLSDEVKLDEEDVPRVLQTFPLLLAVRLERMRAVLDFLRYDLELDPTAAAARSLPLSTSASESSLQLVSSQQMAGSSKGDDGTMATTTDVSISNRDNSTDVSNSNSDSSSSSSGGGGGGGGAAPAGLPLYTSQTVSKILRAFPSLLGLDVTKHLMAVADFLKHIGVVNVGRFVARVPPVLGYDVQENLQPKVDWLIRDMGLSVYDILSFPAYFSYPLPTIIEPRTLFLQLRRRPMTVVGLNSALTGSDADFARKVAKVPPELYGTFKNGYVQNRAAVMEGKMQAKELLGEFAESIALGGGGGGALSSSAATATVAPTPSSDDDGGGGGGDGVRSSFAAVDAEDGDEN